MKQVITTHWVQHQLLHPHSKHISWELSEEGSGEWTPPIELWPWHCELYIMLESTNTKTSMGNKNILCDHDYMCFLFINRVLLFGLLLCSLWFNPLGRWIWLYLMEVHVSLPFNAMIRNRFERKFKIHIQSIDDVVMQNTKRMKTSQVLIKSGTDRGLG